ncbi:MAG: ABC transporter permease [Alphaproteobacteria bacterium]|nr:ABC transporter permease [Alphaproteobacteria bacterium]
MSHAWRTLRQSTISLWILFTLVFFMIRIVPGDPARLMAGLSASEDQLALIRSQLGLDLPIWVQYLRFFERLAGGDLGISTVNRRAVLDQIATGLSYSLPLVLAGMGLAVTLAVPAGIIAGLRRNRGSDLLVTSLAVAATSVPAFWLALLLIDWFAVHWRLLPTSGAGTWRHMVLPAIVLACTQVGLIARLTRGSVIEVMRADYIRTARSKGVSPAGVVARHVLRNAAVPTVTVVGLQTGMVLGGAVVTETVFNWPGVGRLLIQSVLYRDYPMIQGLILLFGASIVLINLAVDLVNMAIDPRLRQR